MQFFLLSKIIVCRILWHNHIGGVFIPLRLCDPAGRETNENKTITGGFIYYRLTGHTHLFVQKHVFG